MFYETFFNNIVSKFLNNARVIITGDSNLNLYNPLKLGYIDIFIASMLSSGFFFFSFITFPAKTNENNSITLYSLID